jgi:hypothetical protein
MSVPGHVLASLHQSDATGIGCAASSLGNDIRQPRRDNPGRLQLEAGRDQARHGNREMRPGQIKTKGLDPELLQTPHDQPGCRARIGGGNIEIRRGLRNRLQQGASVRIDFGRSPQVNAVRLIEPGISALALLGRDDRERKLDLAHFQNGGMGRGCQFRPGGKAKGQTEAIGTA